MVESSLEFAVKNDGNNNLPFWPFI